MADPKLLGVLTKLQKACPPTWDDAGLASELWTEAGRETAALVGRVSELEAALRETGAMRIADQDDGPPTHDYLECWWCVAHTHEREETAEDIAHWPDCRLVELGVVPSRQSGPVAAKPSDSEP